MYFQLEINVETGQMIGPQIAQAMRPSGLKRLTAKT